MSKQPSRKGRSVAVARTDGTTALPAYPPRALPGAGTHLEHVPAVDVPEHAGDVLGEALGAPHEPGVAEELAMGGLVLVGVAVPVGAVRPAGLRLADGPALDADGRVLGCGIHSGRLLRRVTDRRRTGSVRQPGSVTA